MNDIDNKMRNEALKERYPLSIRAWISQREPRDILVTGDEKLYYDFDVSEYAYWFHEKKSKELEARLNQLNNVELSLANEQQRAQELEKKLAESEIAASVEANEADKAREKLAVATEALTDIKIIIRKDGNDNEYEGPEVYIANKALSKLKEMEGK